MESQSLKILNYILCLFVLAFVVIPNCESSEDADQQQMTLINALPRQAGWQAIPSPIIQAGDLINKGLWNDPHVFKEGNRFIMYMTSSSSSNPFKPPILPYRAVSADGLRWFLDPLVPLMNPSGTPFVSIETPSVVNLNGTYHMFYTGVYPEGSANKYAIGHAISSNGINWKLDKTEFLKPTGIATEWNGIIVGEPGAVIYNGKIYVYFTAVGSVPGGSPPLTQSIGYVTTNGVTKSTPKVALKQASYYPNSSNFCGYSTPSAVVEKGVIHLFHDLVIFNNNLQPNWQQVGLAHAYSVDGGISFIQDTSPIHLRYDFDWTRGEIRSPSPLFFDGKLHLWFAGMVPVNSVEFGNLINRGIIGPEFGIGHTSIDTNLLSGAP